MPLPINPPLREGCLLRHAVVSSMDEHARFDGMVPEAEAVGCTPSRPSRGRSLGRAGLRTRDIGAVTVTNCPRPSGAFTVGPAGAKTLSYSLGVPSSGVHHLAGHIAADTLEHGPPPDACMVLIASGGHTSPLLVGTWPGS
ncbi:hypothetical protein ACIGJO_21130 [Streptomyces sp. NPDC079020]|uniref:hypothetical protein n=1 Tax=Streptomyces sp. NPDC079020 TaxID=3365722 RepID=UPI0037CF89C2